MRTAFLPGDASRGSGTVADRPGLTRALDVVRTGDALVVWKLDRIGRSLAHVVELVGALPAKGIGLRVLTGGIDTTSATGRLVFGIFATLAGFERDLIHERTMAGLGRPRAGARPSACGAPWPTACHRPGAAGARRGPGPPCRRRAPRPSSGCRRSGARPRGWPTCARWRRRRRTTCSTCSTPWSRAFRPTPRPPASGRDLDVAALRLGQACAVLFDEGTPDAAVRAAAFEAVTPDALRAAMAHVKELARPEEGSPYVAELRGQARRLGFLPALLRAVRFGCVPAARAVLDAVEHLRAVAEGRPVGKPPLAWIPKGRVGRGGARGRRRRHGRLPRVPAAACARCCGCARPCAGATCMSRRASAMPTCARDCWKGRRGRRPAPPCAAPLPQPISWTDMPLCSDVSI